MEEKYYALLNYGCQMNESDTEHYAGQLEELGYKCVKAQPVDLFPRTAHVETVVQLVKENEV